MKIRNPIYTREGCIDCQVEHPALGWIEFTASPDDPEAHGREIYTRALAMGPAPAPAINPAAELDAARGAAVLSRMAFCLAVHAAGFLPADEAIAAARGDWPASFGAVLAGLPELDAAQAQITWAAASSVERLHPVLIRLRDAGAVTDQQLDAIFGIGGWQ